MCHGSQPVTQQATRDPVPRAWRAAGPAVVRPIDHDARTATSSCRRLPGVNGRPPTATLDEALVAFTEHVDRLGGRHTWWRWVVARLPDGSVIDRPLEPDELDDFHPDDLAERPAELAAAKLAFRDPGQWFAHAWVEAWTQLGLQGLLPVRLGAETELERATIDVLLALPPDQIARRFLEATLASLRESYAQFSFDAYGAESIEGSLRVVRAIAFERVWTTVLSEFDAPSLPFMRGQSPDDWPAHLIGDRSGPFVLLLVDMHL